MTDIPPRPDLIETMPFDPYDGIARLSLHIARLSRSAAAFGIACDRHAIRNELQSATFGLGVPSRVRLMLGGDGGLAIETGPAPARLAEPLMVRVGRLPLPTDDPRLRHKTSDRRFHDAARAVSGTAEVIYVRADGQVTEGSYTNLFVERGGVLLTPPADLGLLPGVLRQSLIDEGRAVEAALTVDDLAGGFLVGNSLRGLMAARLVDSGDGAAL